MLRQIISAYEEGASAQLSDYLKNSMEIFTNNWKRLDRFGDHEAQVCAAGLYLPGMR